MAMNKKQNHKQFHHNLTALENLSQFLSSFFSRLERRIRAKLGN